MPETGLMEKLKHGRPVDFTAEEEAELTEVLRSAMATTLEIAQEEVRDDARIFDDLGLDSIDVFDILDQLADNYEVEVPLEEMPETFRRGEEGTTFKDFAIALVNFLREPPRALPQE